MKAIVLALLFGVILLAFVSLRLKRGPARPLRLFIATFLAFLPLLVVTHLLTPVDLGFLPVDLVAPIWWVDFTFAVFLYAAGFFGGVLQLYNLADRGFSLRILIDVLEAPGGAMTLDDVMTGYSAGRGIAWMYDKRVDGMREAGLIKVSGERAILTERGRRAALVLSRLREFVRAEAGPRAHQ